MSEEEESVGLAALRIPDHESRNQGRLSPVLLLPFQQEGTCSASMAPSATTNQIKSLRRKIEVVREGLPAIEEELRAAIANRSRPEIKWKLALVEERWRREEAHLDELSDLLDSLGTTDGDREARSLSVQLNALERRRIELRVSAENQLEHREDLRSSGPRASSVQLPTYHPPAMKVFSGDVFEWTTFWEKFDANIHQHPNMAAVVKFTELDKCLAGPAAAAIAGLGRQEAHYNTAIEILKERFGKKTAIVDKIMGELFDLPAVREDADAKRLRSLLDGMSTRIRMLTNLGKEESTYADILRPRLIAKLPANIAIDWHEREDCDTAALNDLIKFIERRVDSRERWLLSQTTPNVSGNSDREPRERRRAEWNRAMPGRRPASTASTLFNRVRPRTSGQTKACQLCEKDHRAVDCDMDLQRRVELVKESRRCFNCLGSGHRVADCASKSRCRRCSRRHHTSLCGGGGEPRVPSLTTAPTEAGDGPSVSRPKTLVTSLLSLQPLTDQVLLQTATPFAISRKGRRRILCLFDLGSQRTIVRRQLAEELELEKVGEEFISFIGIGGKESVPKWSKRRRIAVQGTQPDASVVEIEAIEKDKIATVSNEIQHLLSEGLVARRLHLADDRYTGNQLDSCSSIFTTEDEVDLLVGADVYWSLVQHKRTSDGKGITAVKSKFGWLLSGPVRRVRCGRSAQATTMIIQALERPIARPECKWMDSELETESNTGNLKDDINQLTAFFELEHIGIRDVDNDKGKSADLYARYEPLIHRTPEGRFQLPLPWNYNKERLTSNRKLAEARQRFLIKKLSADRPLLMEYNEQIQEFLKQGWIAPVSRIEGALDNYLPHLPVIRRDKRSTKLRIVFDASAKLRGQLCLNDCVHTGDNLYPDMVAIILRFGRHPIAWIGDVTKAFLQLELRPEDRAACRFLWIDDVYNPMTADFVTFQWNRVTFGISCSPFLLAASIRKLLQEHQDLYPKTTASIQENTFVDDWAEGAASVAAAVRTIRQAVEIFDGGKHSIGKWLTNSRELSEELKSAGLATKEAADGHISDLLMGEQSKILGLRWDTAGDFYHFDPTAILAHERSMSGPLTKRRLVQTTAKLFDPIGYLSPLIIVAKMLFQDLWKANLAWDDPVSSHVHQQWTVFVDGLTEIRNIKIPRFLYANGRGQIRLREMHVFCDASNLAYGAVAYLRVRYESGETSVRILASKSRVAPLKTLTIPRLELLATLLGARLLAYLRDSLGMLECAEFLWTDSTVAKAWLLQVDYAKLAQWVRNRVDDIRKLVKPESFRHCPGITNPADMVSRGVTAKHLVDCSLWWQGPEWLSKNASEWPSNGQDVQLTDEESEEVRRELRSLARANLARATTGEPIGWSRLGTYEKAISVTAWVLRFLRHTRSGRPSVQAGDVEDPIVIRAGIRKVKRLQRNELTDAEMCMLRAVQRESYPDEFAQLEQGRTIQRNSTIVGLRPFFDKETKLLRVTGRVEESFKVLNIKPPILLPSDHAVVKLLVNAVHLQLRHMGYRSTFAELKIKFWIVKGRSVVKRTIGACVICRKEHSRAYQEAAACLPLERVKRAQPFQVSGLDYAGPLLIKPWPVVGSRRDNNQLMKSYFFIFSCAVTRAIRLELVPDLSAESFIDALRRFQATSHGTVDTIYSDNAKTFHKASKYLLRLQATRRVHEFLQKSRMEWKFNVSRAPWWGGFWERIKVGGSPNAPEETGALNQRPRPLGHATVPFGTRNSEHITALGYSHHQER